MRCKGSHFYLSDQTFFVLLPLNNYNMRKLPPYIGLLSVYLSVILFALSFFLHKSNNIILIAGLLMMIGGIMIYITSSKRNSDY